VRRRRLGHPGREEGGDRQERPPYRIVRGAGGVEQWEDITDIPVKPQRGGNVWFCPPAYEDGVLAMEAGIPPDVWHEQSEAGKEWFRRVWYYKRLKDLIDVQTK
jgi:hypothetical protein